MSSGGLVKLSNLAPSQRPYAIHVPSFELEAPGRATVEVVWLGRKKGRTTITAGSLYLFSFQHLFVSLADALEHADMRYGGTWMHQWDGHNLLVEPTHPLAPAAHTATAERLDAILSSLPSLPTGQWDGWYYRRTS